MTAYRLLAVALLATTATYCGGSGGDSSTAPSSGSPSGAACTPSIETVCMGRDNTFNPASITISKGATVTWNNPTSVTHNVTFNAQSGAPANISNFSSGSRSDVFAAAGTYPYHCTIHGMSMSGTVVVQ
ncbi:MAG: cupredoxin domain-containing protein [Gemmatimonadaceae bacterium]